MRPALLLASARLVFAADFEVVDKAAFDKIFTADVKVERLATNMKFTEGPAWMIGQGGFLVFSDIPANELKRWDVKNGVAPFRQPSNNANGNTVDREGRLVTAEHGAHRISRTEKNGDVVAIVETHDGKKLNSPNDVVVKSDDTLWFTDPDYGLGGRTKEQQGNYVYRFDPRTKSLTPVIKDFDKPNGLCFSPDESKLYVADSGKPRHIRIFNVDRNGSVSGGEVFATIDKGGPDGIRCDAAGRIWSSSGDGAQIFSPDGKLLARILLPEAAANLTFGGPNGQRVFLTARTSLYAVDTKTKMAPRPKP
ncbi:MAG TPA: SMP-30/gluconolactonase/LRE family protein [Bryobacteraceae bacterium]|nr:SMP-30/gluconolactonase/LRE family protein [Bryobacteraceae bacterium]